MNREGKTYRSERLSASDKNKINGSVVVVTRSVKWSPALEDRLSNYTHHALVLECPEDPAQVGAEVRIDERVYVYDDRVVTSWERDDLYYEVG